MSKIPLAFKPRIIAGQKVLVPCDTFTRQWILGAKDDGLLWVNVKRPRSPHFHRAVHMLSKWLGENVEKFSGMSPHDVLKTVQLESRLHCKAMALDVPNYGRIMHLIPESIDFETLDETEFRSLIDSLADYVRDNYCPDFSLDLLDKNQ